MDKWPGDSETLPAPCGPFPVEVYLLCDAGMSAKRLRTPDVLEVDEIKAPLAQLEDPFRTMVFLAAATANSRTTLDVYTQGLMSTTRLAQGRVVKSLLAPRGPMPGPSVVVNA